MQEAWKSTAVRDLAEGDVIAVNGASERVTFHQQHGNRDWYRYGVTGNQDRYVSGGRRVQKLVSTTQIDFVMGSGETAEKVFAEMTNGHKVQMSLVAESGSNGHPVAEVYGKTEDVARFLWEFGYPNPDETRYPL